MNEQLKQLIISSDRIFFVCSGNIIRSSFADLYAKSLGLLNVSSYGTTYYNKHIHNRSAQELRRLEIDNQLINSFKPTHIDEILDFGENDIHFVMTQKHVHQLLDNSIPNSRIFKITACLGKSSDIADPYFEGNFESAYSTIKDAVEQIAKVISGDL